MSLFTLLERIVMEERLSRRDADFGCFTYQVRRVFHHLANHYQANTCRSNLIIRALRVVILESAKRCKKWRWLKTDSGRWSPQPVAVFPSHWLKLLVDNLCLLLFLVKKEIVARPPIHLVIYFAVEKSQKREKIVFSRLYSVSCHSIRSVTRLNTIRFAPTAARCWKSDEEKNG